MDSALDLFCGQPGLDAEILLLPNGRARIRQLTSATRNHVDTTFIDVDERGGTIRIDGNVTCLQGNLRGRLTIVCSESVSITGDLHCVDDTGRRSDDPKYDGESALGVVAEESIRFQADATINVVLLSRIGRIAVCGYPDHGEALRDRAIRISDETIAIVSQSDLADLPAFADLVSTRPIPRAV